MIKYILSFIGLATAQILIFNQIQFSGYINPSFYLLFVLLLPINSPAWIRLLSAFLLGFTIDIFSQSPGIHSSATVFIAFIQPYLVMAFKNTDIDESKPCSLSRLGFKWFISYSMFMILIHHSIYFILEVFSFNQLADTLFRIVISSFATFTAILLAQLVIYKKHQ